MDELELQDRPGLFSRLAGMFSRDREDDADDYAMDQRARPLELRPVYKYNVTVRRQVTSFDDALAAANGFKRGEQQILNLAHTEPMLRQKIVDFMCGVNYAQEGCWEEIGDNIYLVVPSTAFVEVAPPTPRSNSLRN